MSRFLIHEISHLPECGVGGGEKDHKCADLIGAECGFKIFANPGTPAWKNFVNQAIDTFMNGVYKNSIVPGARLVMDRKKVTAGKDEISFLQNLKKTVKDAKSFSNFKDAFRNNWDDDYDKAREDCGLKSK